MAKKRRNPLNKRYLRELKQDLGKYLVIFAMMIITIGLCSGFMIADNSMLKAYDESFDRYNIEDGNFTVKRKLTDKQIDKVEESQVKLYPMYSYTEKMKNGSRLRIYADRNQVNKVCLMEGKLPEKDYEIAIDRMHADNNKYKIGDRLESEEGKVYTITGLVALSDYSCLYEKNTDSMFEATGFGVAIVSPEMFTTYDKDRLKYTYSWKYNQTPKDNIEAKQMGDDFLEDINRQVMLDTFVPRYANMAINFAGEDMGKDGLIVQVFCYMLIGLLAFIFAIISKHTIEREATVIGTLRASGFSRFELIRHYLTVPMIVSIISSFVGNVAGYTFFKDFSADMYYGSYSLTTYKTIWNADAFVLTTVIPLIIMLVVNLIVLYVNLRKPVQKFLRGDLGSGRNKMGVRLNPKLRILKRFKLRVILQNIPSFVLIFVGAVFANLILMFGLAIPTILSNFSSNLKENMFAQYQYSFVLPVSVDYTGEPDEIATMLEYEHMLKTSNKDAEKFTAHVLQTTEDAPMIEEVLIYGVEKDSRYVDIDHDRNGVYISSAFADKYNLKAGDRIILTEKYEEKDYSIRIVGVYDYDGAVAMFGDMEWVNEFFDMPKNTYAGYFSDTEITDINEKYIANVTDYDALNKITRQLEVSMGNLIYMLDGFAVIIFIVVVYLLSKIIIDRNAHSISVTRILGYNKGEIGGIYITSISAAVIGCFTISLPIVYFALIAIYKSMISSMMPGWLPISIGPLIFVEMLLICIAAYAVVALLEYGKVRKIPMDIALKTVE